jgi:aspartate/methionine/tyrosine aminotransferase
VPVDVSCFRRRRVLVTVDQLEAAVTDRTKVLLFVSPSNPTGAVYPVEEVEAIGRWAVERGLWVVTDEIYEHLIRRPPLQLDADARPRGATARRANGSPRPTP